LAGIAVKFSRENQLFFLEREPSQRAAHGHRFLFLNLVWVERWGQLAFGFLATDEPQIEHRSGESQIGGWPSRSDAMTIVWHFMDEYGVRRQSGNGDGACHHSPK